MPRRHLRTCSLAGLLSALALAACSSGGGRGGPHPIGATTFESAAPSSGGARLDAPTAGGGAVPSAGPEAGQARAVEEADIYQRAGSTLYVLNAYRGLQIVDLSDLSAPRLLSRLPLGGTPVDLYLRGSVALVVVSDWFSYLPVAAAEVARPVRGSRLFAVDVADPSAPRILAEQAIEGEVQATRIVGNALYAVSRRWWWYEWIGPASPAAADVAGVAGPSSAADTVFVQSFDVAEPSAPRAVDRVELPASGWSTHANVTAERVTLSFAGWGPDGQGIHGPLTRFQVVDISDAGGALAAGAAFEAPGLVQDRWGMDYDAGSGLFRAVVASGFWNGGAALQIWRSPGPGAVEPISRLAVEVQESLTAARFDGSRVYLVTALQIDPLWVIDASDPAQPRIAGHLTMPGQLDFIEPRGDRLVALGHTNEAGQPFQLAVSLFDVADAAAPALLSRAIFGASWGWVGVQPDDLRKAFLVFDPPPDGIGLVLVPVQGWDSATWRYQGGTQLLDLSRDTLTLQGFLAHPGVVRRAFPADATGASLVALSDQAMQTIDAADRGHPAERARLDLSRPVSALAILGDKAIELCGDWSRGDMELAVTEALDPDAATPLARVQVAAPSARMFQDGTVTWLLARDWTTGAGWLQAVDFADPLHPAPRGRHDLGAEESPATAGSRWGYGDEAVLVGHALVIHRTTWRPLGAACPGCGGEWQDRMWVYDLADPDRPRLASTVVLPANGWSWGLMTSGSFVWLTHFEWMPPFDRGRYYVDRIDLSDPARPVLLPKVNVPGVLFGASEDGARLFTLETEWSADGAAASWAHGLRLQGSEASLYGSVELPGYPSGAALAGGHAYVGTATWTTGTGQARLASIELSEMAVASEQAVEGSWTWVTKAAGGKLFLQAGWQDQGILIYSLADPGRPALERFERTKGWVSDIVVSGDHAWLPSGPFGVPVVPLAP